MRYRSQRFEFTVDVRATLSKPKPITAAEPWPLGHDGSGGASVAALAAFNARERRLFDALRSHGPSLDAWLAEEALVCCLYGGNEIMYDHSESEDEIWAHVATLVPRDSREVVEKMIHVSDEGPMAHFPVYHAPSAKVVRMELAPHGPPSLLEGPAPIPAIAWHHVVLTVEARMNDLDPSMVARAWHDLPDELRGMVGSRERFTGHLRAMQETTLANGRVGDYLLRTHARNACEMPDERLVDNDGGDRALRNRIATLPPEDRAYYARFSEDSGDDNRLSFYDVTFGIRRATTSEAEAYRVRSVA